MENCELYHHGIKGQKWGVRRSPEQLGHRTKKQTNRYSDMSDDAKAVSELRKKKPYQMSNAELRKLNERIQLEQQYSNLNPSTVNKGLKAVNKTLAVLGTVAAGIGTIEKLAKIGKKAVSMASKSAG